MTRLLSAAVLALLASTTAGHAQTSATALADVSQIAPGESFKVAVRFDIEPGWHIYWKHPGDSGLPTEIRSSSPDGVTVGPWRLPTPTRFGQPGGIAGLGYADSTVFVADVTTSTAVTDSFTLELTADWLMCQDRCIPGTAVFEVPITIGDDRLDRENASATIEQWDPDMPGAIEDQSPFRIEVERTPSPEGGLASVHVTWPDGETPSSVDWLPNPAMEISVASVEIAPSTVNSEATDITFTWEKWGNPHSFSLESLITWIDDSGHLRGHEITFDLLEPTN